MEKLTLDFIKNLGWIEFYPSENAPPQCFHKNRYPVALWWDDVQLGFWVIYLNDVSKNTVVVGKDFMQTVKEYDALISPILKALALADKETLNNS